MPCIHQGTPEMLDEMLSDLGLSEVKYRTWSVTSFRSNHFSSSDEPVSSPNSWSASWELSLELDDALSDGFAAPRDDYNILRTYALDKTWDGKDPSGTLTYRIVGRFYNPILLDRALIAFESLWAPIRQHDPDVGDMVERLRRHPQASQISARALPTGALDLEVSIGTYDRATFTSSGAVAAELACDLIHELAGTTTWDEQLSRLARAGH